MALARRQLERLLKALALCFAAVVVYVLLDSLIDLRPPGIESSYYFNIAGLEPDRPRILRQDNLSILVMLRSRQSLERLARSVGDLQDPQSENSRQPEFAKNPLRSRNPEYFVAYALGTDLGCPLQIEVDGFRETCGSAAYDHAGRARRGDKDFPNLAIPDYNFDEQFETLTVRP